jgi:hypothetical protein
MDLQMHMDWRRGGSTILGEAWGVVDDNEASGIPESKVSIPVDWWI